MIPPLLLGCIPYNSSQKIPSDDSYRKNQAFCCLMTCHQLPLPVHSYAVCSIHLCRPDLFLYKEGKAEQRTLVGKERMTPLCFCWFAAQMLVECLHLLFWYLNFPLLTVRQQPGVMSTVCYKEG